MQQIITTAATYLNDRGLSSRSFTRDFVSKFLILLFFLSEVNYYSSDKNASVVVIYVTNIADNNNTIVIIDLADIEDTVYVRYSQRTIS